MAIIFHEKSRQFHLYNTDISYIIEVMDNGQLGNLYYGKRIHEREDYSYLHEEVYCPHEVFCQEAPSLLGLSRMKQEYPGNGVGDYRIGAFLIEQENGSRVSDFQYVSHEIYAGKRPLQNLPAVYTEKDEEAVSLDICLRDAVTDTELILTYTIFEQYPAIIRSARFTQTGEGEIVLQSAMSASVDLRDRDYEMLQLSGAWARERSIVRRKLCQGLQSVFSNRGISSAEQNPFVALVRPTTDENHGEVYGFSFVYSGSFLAQAEVCAYDTTRVTMGIHPDNFAWPLSQGESFQTPEVVMVYSDRGFNYMSQAYQELYAKRLARGMWRDQERPILLNNWEATYMDFDEEKILKIAATAKEAGVELFVLDDGWFGTRDDDWQGLGDWYVNRRKLPNGISGLSKAVEDMGMRFGIWIEPEMVNKNSDLYRAHPDWVISTPDRFESPARQQHVLDYSRPEVVDHIYKMLSEVIEDSCISYIKWDMNRYLSECYSRVAGARDQGTVMHKYILGVYRLYERLIAKFPEILFESCASGGARFDPGMLYYAPQAWCSDDTDVCERVKIQYGTSLVYPIRSIGAHVSAVPNHQNKRTTPLLTRGNVAFYGAFGYELDLNKLSAEEMKMVKEQIVFYKKYRKLIQQGKFYRILNPFEGNEASWISVSEDAKEAVAMYFQRLNTVNGGFLRILLTGLSEDTFYEVQYLDRTLQLYGNELMNAGIPVERKLLDKLGGDFTSLLFVIKAVEA
ncbi:MAG: alpha-galactosidase [bacterium]|nr:alpha-galactosidase [bacterium]